MEVALEGILETLLVGSIASLCLLTLLFLLIPNFIRVRTVHLLFRFFLYEDEKPLHRTSRPPPPAPEFTGPELTGPELAAASDAPKPATDEPSDPTQIKADESRSLFAGVLLCAALYGAGIVAESVSDRLTEFSFAGGPFSGLLFSDPEIRIDAFEKVGTGALVAGNASPIFEEFMTDYGACHDAGLLRNSRFSPTCNAMQAKAMAFYYEAKNAVYREASYFEELSRLQTRINFTRGMGTAFVALALLLGVGGAIAVLFEAAYRARSQRSLLVRPVAAAYRMLGRSRFFGPLVRHWTHLAEGRMFLMASVALLVGLASQVAWRDNEDEFDRRVFGYFLSMALTPQTPAAQRSASEPYDGERQNNEIERTEPSYRGLPASTYRTFEVSGQHRRFEPSAIAVLEGNKVLVANDKGSPNLVVLEFDEQRGLDELHSLELCIPAQAEGVDDALAPLPKIEALHTLPLRDGHEVFAAANEDRSGVNKPWLVSFHLDAGAKVITAPQRLQLEPEPCELIVESGSPASCVVEGLTASPGNGVEPRDLLVGLRYLGVQRQATLTLLRYARADQRWKGERLWTATLPSHPKTHAANPFTGSGISALETASDGSLLVLTSYEIDEQPGSTSQVSGALWRIPPHEITAPQPENWFADLDKPREFPNTYLVNVFTHKPEGIAMLDNHSMVVVFDDDGKRKSRRYAPKTFALDQNQAAFTLIRPLAQGGE
jgi:hypothetical protein